MSETVLDAIVKGVVGDIWARAVKLGATAEQREKRQSRAEQGWQKRRPLTSERATQSRDGRIYERDANGTIRKGARVA